MAAPALAAECVAIPAILNRSIGTSKENEMRVRRISCYPLQLIGICLFLLTGSGTGEAGQPERKFSFAVIADPRSRGDTWKNALLEIRDGKANQDPPFAPAELIVVLGDMDPIESRYEDYLRIFTNEDARPVFLPVIGNHEFENGGAHFRFARDVLIPSIPRVCRRHAASCDYYLDHKNVRVVVVDAYTDLGKLGVINEEGREWVEQVIKETPSTIEHIFIAFHEPAFPRFRHIGDSFDQDPERRNAFWRMLLAYKDRVRAVFVGHTHAYYRMRVLDPAGIAANDPNVFPNEDGGIYQIDAGAAGMGNVNTIVQVQIEGGNLLFRVLQAENGNNKPFAEIDRWNIFHNPRKSGNQADVESGTEDHGLKSEP